MTQRTGSEAGLVYVQAADSRSVCLADEVPVALTYNGTTQAVMMASPLDLEDFLIGFSITEGLIAQPAEIESLEIVEHDDGYEARAWLATQTAARFTARRRAMLGPVGCGLCGIDSIEQAVRAVPAASASQTIRIAVSTPARALEEMRGHQVLHGKTRATHAAGFWREGQGIVCIREDVGRHNALDKLVGALLRSGTEIGGGAIVMTSRLSVDLVQKAAMVGAPVIVAPSAPTALAVRQAEQAGITLVARQGDRVGVYTHPQRVADEG
ncbi:formate dehydrogenase accessory sulfurtransferase FdhD [Rhizobiaceae bacterium BDR2-2]|uniref:Sulfur carrier protein FdhD n=1 Tax=Ectorhizobium quercum TaxID=2965071 RepID=A0AAE3N5L2_9HYPH|nr:formate dehydrogenase accessory sulfurtransferase FdhD [Ectorhizobium quercum]MCX8999690.1 formate dehydrogenase accessory sulfurtransferase FdhD [Ectorhizobium quercum]